MTFKKVDGDGWNIDSTEDFWEKARRYLTFGIDFKVTDKHGHDKEIRFRCMPAQLHLAAKTFNKIRHLVSDNMAAYHRSVYAIGTLAIMRILNEKESEEMELLENIQDAVSEISDRREIKRLWTALSDAHTEAVSQQDFPSARKIEKLRERLEKI